MGSTASDFDLRFDFLSDALLLLLVLVLLRLLRDGASSRFLSSVRDSCFCLISVAALFACSSGAILDSACLIACRRAFLACFRSDLVSCSGSN